MLFLLLKTPLKLLRTSMRHLRLPRKTTITWLRLMKTISQRKSLVESIEKTSLGREERNQEIELREVTETTSIVKSLMIELRDLKKISLGKIDIKQEIDTVKKGRIGIDREAKSLRSANQGLTPTTINLARMFLSPRAEIARLST